jgi:hypothetical protein
MYYKQVFKFAFSPSIFGIKYIFDKNYVNDIRARFMLQIMFVLYFSTVTVQQAAVHTNFALTTRYANPSCIAHLDVRMGAVKMASASRTGTAHICTENFNLGYNTCQYNLDIGSTLCVDSHGKSVLRVET